VQQVQPSQQRQQFAPAVNWGAGTAGVQSDDGETEGYVRNNFGGTVASAPVNTIPVNPSVSKEEIAAKTLERITEMRRAQSRVSGGATGN
jgi:hypothetical protein